MIDIKKVLVIIPARAGSKGVPGKNKKILSGKPLISYTLEAALEVFEANQICVSTNDDDILALSKGYNIPILFKRPEELSTDTSSSLSVIKHALGIYEKQYHKYEAIVFLQPTSPFRTSDHIQSALDDFSITDDLVISVKETEANPYYVLFEEDGEKNLKKSKSHDATRRQDLPIVYEATGALYIINRYSLEKVDNLSALPQIKKYVMDARSSVDIDTPLDWEFAEFLMNKNK